MAAGPFELIFNCTLAQFTTALGTTLPGAGFTVLNIPVQLTGIIKGTSGGAIALKEIDFIYDGVAFLKFFGGNMTTALVTYLTTTLAGTLGAPVPVNLANNPSFQI
jgi:hypothetical protein